MGLSARFAVIRLDGFLDISRYPSFRTAFEEARTDEPLLIDLTAATGVDSTFLSELLMLRLRHATRIAVVIPRGGRVEQMFSIAGLGKRLDIFTSREEALDALRDDQPEST